MLIYCKLSSTFVECFVLYWTIYHQEWEFPMLVIIFYQSQQNCALIHMPMKFSEPSNYLQLHLAYSKNHCPWRLNTDHATPREAVPTPADHEHYPLWNGHCTVFILSTLDWHHGVGSCRRVPPQCMGHRTAMRQYLTDCAIHLSVSLH